MKYLLIDGNNLACRASFGNPDLRSSNGIPTGVHFGFFNSLINLKQQYPDYQFLISWDGKSKRRVSEAKAGVEKGLIKSGYKENRDKEALPQPLKDFFAQAPFLKQAIEQTGIPQIRLPDFETDDVIASYCKTLEKDNEVVVVTGDEDYMQLLSDKVSIWDGKKQKHITRDAWVKETGITPDQFVHVGALMGDTGDNIFGVYGVGYETALDLIKEHGTWENVYAAFHKDVDSLRVQYPDLKNSPDEFKRLEEIKTKSGKQKYVGVTINLPFTGVALALEDKKIKGLPKTTIMTLMFEERVRLAYSLKKMDVIENLPEIKQGQYNGDRLQEYLDYYEMQSIKDTIDILKG